MKYNVRKKFGIFLIITAIIMSMFILQGQTAQESHSKNIEDNGLPEFIPSQLSPIVMENISCANPPCGGGWG